MCHEQWALTVIKLLRFFFVLIYSIIKSFTLSYRPTWCGHPHQEAWTSSGRPADVARRASQIKCDSRRSPSSFAVPYQAKSFPLNEFTVTQETQSSLNWFQWSITLSQKKYFRRSSLQRTLTSLTE